MFHLKIGVPPWVIYPQARMTWLSDEKLMHINALELKAILIAQKTFVKASHKHIKVIFENTIAIQCINKMETPPSMECQHQDLKTWECVIIHKIIFKQLTFQAN